MTFLVVPTLEKAHGTGHFSRSCELIRSLRALGAEAYLWAGGGAPPLVSPDTSFFVFDERARAWDCIVLDRFHAPSEEFDKWSALGPVIGIDEGGIRRRDFPFLIDLLPPLPQAPPANMLCPSLLPLPRARRDSFHGRGGAGDVPLRILVAFGGSDPENLAVPLCRILAAPDLVSITALAPDPPHCEGVTFLSRIPDLRERLAEYDLVITHFGLTAFESVHARVPVLIVSPSAYHERLARCAGFVSAGLTQKGIGRVPKLLYRGNKINRRFWGKLGNACETIAARYGLKEPPARDLPGLLRGFSPRFPRACPVCGSTGAGPVLARFTDRTYRRCPACGLVYMLRPAPPPLEYDRSYFFEMYRNQYGKTYLEDFPALTKAAESRLDTIGAVLSRDVEAPRILDIGCAYGAFLAAARERGFSPLGIDPTEDAARYAREELGLPVLRGFFPEAARDFPSGSFDAISLWYVIEHFENLAEVFAEIRRLLKTGGVLSFATPSFGGVSAKVSAAGFLEKSPADHFTLWDPKHTANILKRHGFILKKIVISGHHPERFPLVGRIFKSRRQGMLYRLCLWISKIFRLGDTFEAHGILAKPPEQSGAGAGIS